MNKKAEQLGCVNTHFVTPNGLDGEDEGGIHSTTAAELATIMAYCIKNSEFLKITQTKDYTFSSIIKNEKELSNSDSTNSSKDFSISKGITYSVGNANAFLNMYENIISGKTGFTGNAGYCYICAYKCVTVRSVCNILYGDAHGITWRHEPFYGSCIRWNADAYLCVDCIYRHSLSCGNACRGIP